MLSDSSSAEVVPPGRKPQMTDVYPSAQIFTVQEKGPSYLEAAAHRFAAVLTQIAVRCAPAVQREKLG